MPTFSTTTPLANEVPPKGLAYEGEKRGGEKIAQQPKREKKETRIERGLVRAHQPKNRRARNTTLRVWELRVW
jgi:hypothetical protein